MTAKQRKFVEEVLSGCSYTEAYRRAYPKSLTWAPITLKTEASRTASTPKVKAAIEQGQAEARAAANITRDDILQALGKIVKRVGKDATAPAAAVVAASTQASRMLGCDAPTKIEMKVEGSLLHRIRKTTAK